MGNELEVTNISARRFWSGLEAEQDERKDEEMEQDDRSANWNRVTFVKE